MKNNKNENKGPSCACGKGTDLFEEWKKLNEKEKKDGSSKAKETKKSSTP